MTRPAQPEVDAYFDEVAGWWRDVYDAETVEGAIYRRRHDRVVDWIDGLGLAPAAPVLEVGAGAGLLTAELAARGFDVTAVDSSEVMVELIRERAARAPGATRVTAAVADAHALDLPDASYDLVVALGVVPWLHDPVRGLRELARVARRGAAIIVTSDNRARLSHAADPRLNPALRPARHALRRRLARRGLVAAEPPSDFANLYSRRELLAMLRDAGLLVERLESVGFGPFTLGGRRLGSERAGVRADAALQRLADRRAPGLGSRGSHHLVLARPS